MPITTQLGSPNKNDIIDGKYALTRYHLCEAAVAAPVTPANVYSIQEVSAEPNTPQVERKTFQQGGGDDYYLDQRQYEYSGSIRVKAGEVQTLMAGLLNMTHDVSNYAAIPLRFSDYPVATLEVIYRQDNNETHLFSMIYQDVILKPFNIGSPMEDNEVDIPFYAKHDPFILCSGAEMVYDEFNGDGSTTDFTLSSTPIDLVNTTDLKREDWELDNLVYVKVKTSSDDTGTRQRSGISETGGVVTIATAPASGSTVQILYAKET